MPILDSDDLQTAALAVILIVMVTSGGAWADAPSIDKDRTASASISEVRGGSVIERFAPVDGQQSVLQAEYDSKNPGVRIYGPDGEKLRTFTREDMERTGNDSVLSTYYYNTSIPHTLWRSIEIAPGERVTVTVQLINNTRATNPDTTNISLVLAGSNCRTVRLANEDADEDEFSASRSGFRVPFIGTFGGEPKSRYAAASMPINGSNSTVEIHYENLTAIDSFETSTRNLEEGEWAKRVIVETDKGPMRTYVDVVPTDVSDTETYAVYDTQDDVLYIHAGTDYAAETELKEVSITSNAGFFERLEAYGFTFGGQTFGESGS